MAGTRLFFGGRDDPDVVAQGSCNGLEKPQAARVHAIVVGEKDAHVAAMVERSLSRNHPPDCAISATALAIYSPTVGKFLFSVLGLSIGADGDHRFSHKYRESQ